jgi:hypothetical protein
MANLYSWQLKYALQLPGGTASILTDLSSGRLNPGRWPVFPFRVPNTNGVFTIKERSRHFCMRHLATIAALGPLCPGWLGG